MIESMIAAAMARPMTHVVLTRYADGSTKRHETRGCAEAANWAIGEDRKIGRDLVDRVTGKTVCVVAVEIERLP